MNLRPRCLNWLPLSTQQLRLRNLLRIQGYNIACRVRNDGDAVIYYTLHYTKEGEAFYTSEALPRRQLQQKWADIACPTMLKSNANCVCVKVWARPADGVELVTEQETESQEETEDEKQRAAEAEALLHKEPVSALTKELANTCLFPHNLLRPPNKLLFTWGVYFSGLIQLNQETDTKCSSNALVFQINDEYFASPEHFTPEHLREQLSLNYHRYADSLPHAISRMPADAAVDDPYSINSPPVSRSASPVRADVAMADLLRMSKARYTQLHCARSAVRISYDLKQLLQLQQRQRQKLQVQRETVESAAEIKCRSVRCITRDQLLRKPRTTSLSSSAGSGAKSGLHSHYNHHSMGRKLSVLLAEQQQIDPHAMLRAQQLQEQLETLRCKQRLLESERDTFTLRLGQLRQRLRVDSAQREQRAAWLKARRDELSEDVGALTVRYGQLLVRSQQRRHIVQHVERRLAALCMELSEIYPIGRNAQGHRTVCGVPLPKLDAYVSDSKYANTIGIEQVSPMAVSASLGYIAHLVQMIAVIINRPLRNPILHEGSRTRIMDVIKELPHTAREFPLYTRSTLPSQPMKYAIYLLNQNIVQLCFDITGLRCDPRYTIDNLQLIFAWSQPTNCLTPSATTTTNGDDAAHIDRVCDHGLSKSHSSVDMQHVVQPPSVVQTLLGAPKASGGVTPIIDVQRGAAMSLQQRVSRSVGSYSDCDDDDDFKDRSLSDHCYSNSDSNINFRSEHI